MKKSQKKLTPFQRKKLLKKKLNSKKKKKNLQSQKLLAKKVVDGESEGTPQPDLQSIEGSDDNVTEEVNQQKPPMVPKSRLDEVLAKQKALQKQLDEMNKAKQEASKENAPEYDFTAKEAEYQELVLEW